MDKQNYIDSQKTKQQAIEQRIRVDDILKQIEPDRENLK